jgi:prophage antirepressor-like protein
MNELKIFENPEFGSIRTLEINGEPWFVLADVCKVLEIARGTKVAERLEEDEVRQTSVIDSLGREQKTYIINESGLYSVILRSDKPQAKPFRKWVTSEVLPTIRKHGAYMTADTLEAAILNPDYLIQILTALKGEQEKRKALEAETAVQKQQIAELQPKASYYDVVLNCKDLLSVTEIAKDYGKSGTWLNKKLHELGVQFKQGKIWLLYQKYAEKGYTSTKTHTYPADDGEVHTKVHTYWTQKGRLFIYEQLKGEGILPIIEREQAEVTKQ